MVMCCAVDSTDAVARMEQIHKTSAVVTAAEGRLLTAASIMGTMLKSANDSVTLRVEGNGPVGMLIAVSDVHDTFCHFLIGTEHAALFQKLIDQGGLAVVYMSDDCYISYIFTFHTKNLFFVVSLNILQI